jgi:N-acetyl-anhydromuramyl-L-alanine amidase AmpD
MMTPEELRTALEQGLRDALNDTKELAMLEVKSSAHYSVATDGKITELVPQRTPTMRR